MSLNIIEIPIAEITVGADRRQMGELTELMRTISEVGLLNPITVSADNQLIAGLHRLHACKKLGWTTIPANVVQLDETESELAEIDENLIRNPLTALEKSEQMLRRKEIYEALHPDATAGSRRAAGMNRANGKHVDETVSPTCVEDIASKAKVSKRNVQHYIKIATNIESHVKDMIRDTPVANNTRALLKLSRLDAESQVKEVERLSQPKTSSLRCPSPQTTAQPNEDLTDCFNERFSTIVADVSQNADVDMLLSTIRRTALKDSALWLWSSNVGLPQSFKILDEAGFAIKTILTWIKSSSSDSNVIHERTAHCIVGLKGSPKFELSDQGLGLIAPANADQARPDEFYDLVERLCPLSKIDLGVTTQRSGWGITPIEPSNECDQTGIVEKQNEEPEQSEILMLDSIVKKLGQELPIDENARLQLMKEALRQIKMVPSEAKKFGANEREFVNNWIKMKTLKELEQHVLHSKLVG